MSIAANRKSKKPKYQKTGKEYAALYSCDIRTITRYKAQGFPLDDYEQMQEILNSQKNRPEGDSENLPEGEISQAEAKRRKTVVEWKKLAFSFEVEQGKYTANDKIREDWFAIGAATGAALDKLRADLPALLLGLDESSMAAAIEKETSQIRAQLADQMSRLYGTRS